MAIDLEAIAQQIRWVQDDKDHSLAWRLAANTLPEVIAELGLARTLRDALNVPGSRLLSTQAKQALDAYNQHMGETSDAS